jgi:hypothetical protein
MDERRYRVAWQTADFSSHGLYCLTRDEAQIWADQQNEKYAGSVIHWIEERPATHKNGIEK